jgi:hypothetical protein
LLTKPTFFGRFDQQNILVAETPSTSGGVKTRHSPSKTGVLKERPMARRSRLGLDVEHGDGMQEKARDPCTTMASRNHNASLSPSREVLSRGGFSAANATDRRGHSQ